MENWSFLGSISDGILTLMRLWRSPSGVTRYRPCLWMPLSNHMSCVARASRSCTCTSAAWRRAGSPGWWSLTGGTHQWPGGSSCPAPYSEQRGKYCIYVTLLIPTGLCCNIVYTRYTCLMSKYNLCVNKHAQSTVVFDIWCSRFMNV